MIELAALALFLWICMAGWLYAIWKDRTQLGLQDPNYWTSQGPSKQTAEAKAKAKSINGDEIS
jgi:hypothetical protein